MASQSQTTTDHDQIRRRVEQYDGVPAAVRDASEDPDRDGWFRTFDRGNVASPHPEHGADGSDSTFFGLVAR